MNRDAFTIAAGFFLFVFSNSYKGQMTKSVVFFLFVCFYRYLNAIQTMCPHILRYLTTAVITNKDVRKRRQVLKDLVKVIQQVVDSALSSTNSWVT